MKKFLSKFKGTPLNDEQIAHGMHLCFCNAKELLEDASFLKDNGRHSRALSLAILSLEELGKIPLLLNTVLYPKGQNDEWKSFWSSFTSHKSKQLVWTVYGTTLKEYFGLDAYDEKYPPDLQPLIDKLKQLGFYVAFFEKQFIAPRDFIDDNVEWMEWIIELAKSRIDKFAQLHSSLDDSMKAVRTSRELITAFVDANNKSEFAEAINKIIENNKKE